MRRWKPLRLTTMTAILAAAVVAVGMAVLGKPRVNTPAAQVTTATAAVVRGTVTERIVVTGVLGFGGTYPVAHQGPPGILTAAAKPGTVLGRGDILYAVANRPVRLLIGEIPAYRDLAPGVADGPDVAQLEQNLAVLGFDPGRVDTLFTSTTAAAVRKLRQSWGLPPTGNLPLGSFHFSGVPLRVARFQTVIGMEVPTGEVILSATSTDRVVTAPLAADRRQGVKPGDRVPVTVTGLPAVEGTVLRVEPYAGAEDPPPAPFTVTVGVEVPAGVEDVPAQMALTTAVRRDVLLVPVVALLARPGGGYQVRLASGELVPVRPGLFDNTAGTVEVTGDLDEGELVEVPAS
ncbi:MAG TPA: peptidoglycan-binding domain-containing protein [Candidatus Limnocylindrales bacterium]